MCVCTCVTCPRCLGNYSVVCCALCNDKRTVPQRLSQKYYTALRRSGERVLDLDTTWRIRDRYWKSVGRPVVQAAGLRVR